MTATMSATTTETAPVKADPQAVAEAQRARQRLAEQKTKILQGSHFAKLRDLVRGVVPPAFDSLGKSLKAEVAQLDKLAAELLAENESGLDALAAALDSVTDGGEASTLVEATESVRTAKLSHFERAAKLCRECATLALKIRDELNASATKLDATAAKAIDDAEKLLLDGGWDDVAMTGSEGYGAAAQQKRRAYAMRQKGAREAISLASLVKTEAASATNSYRDADRRANQAQAAIAEMALASTRV